MSKEKEHDNLVTFQLRKHNGKLIHRDKGSKALAEEFIKSLTEKQVVDVFMTTSGSSGTNMQLSKIHPCIRKLANEMGHTFEEMKLVVKRRSGLAYGDLENKAGFIKSFADCSAEELSGVIQTIIEIGDFIGINFRGKLPESHHRK